MRVVAFTKSNLQRQALEAHHINTNASNNVLNRRGEWGQNLPPKLVVEGEEEKTGNKRNREQGRTSRCKRRRENPPEDNVEPEPKTTNEKPVTNQELGAKIGQNVPPKGAGEEPHETLTKQKKDEVDDLPSELDKIKLEPSSANNNPDVTENRGKKAKNALKRYEDREIKPEVKQKKVKPLKRSTKPVSGREMVDYIQRKRAREEVQRDAENPPQESETQEFLPLQKHIPEVHEKPPIPTPDAPNQQGIKIKQSLSSGGVRSNLTRGQKIMQGKLAKGYNGKSQVQRSKLILEGFLYREPNHGSSHSISGKDSPESFPPIDPEEAPSERLVPDSTGAKA